MKLKFVEAEGKTVKEAIDLALKELGTMRDKVDIKVLVEENKGLFGMKGAAFAKVRVSLKK